MRTVIVTGSRNHTDHVLIWEALDEANPELVVQGGAQGADSIAAAWCKKNSIPCCLVPADWNRFGKPAGGIRNNKMLKMFPQALVLAFPLGLSWGTRYCISRANALQMSTRVFG